MAAPADPALQRALDALAPGVVIGHRLIADGDEDALLDAEAASITTTVAAARRASGAARRVARDLLARLGHPGCVLPRTASGAPAWPDGVVGSLAHDAAVAVAAVAKASDVAALGIDVEPAAPLEPDLVDLVAVASERPQIAADPLGGRLLFVAKEAAYKAVHPLDGVFLEFSDIAVDLVGRTATVRNGRVVDLRWVRAPRIVVLALVTGG